VTARILIVDDEPEICEELAEFLEMKGHAPVLAHTVADARALLEGGRFDLVVSDLRLGRESGLDVVAAARGTQGTIPVLLVSGQLNAEVEHAAHELGVTRCIGKPLDPRLVLGMLAGDAG
jgi:DNA-binding response OmpR family regulator